MKYSLTYLFALATRRHHSLRHRLARATVFGLLAIAAMTLANPLARADVTAIGDVTPNMDPDLPLFGGTASEAIIVGDTEIGRLTVDVPAFTEPLVSPGGTIGNTATGIGEAVVSGFNSEWQVQGALSIGKLGLGYLDLVGGARVSGDDEVDDNGTPDDPSDDTVTNPGSIVIGDGAGSLGFVTVDGFGSRLETFALSIGNEGIGQLDVFNRGNVLSTGSASIGVPDDSVGRVSLTGAGSRWVVQDTLTIGNSATGSSSGHSLLKIDDQALVQVNNVTTIDARGRIELHEGTLRTTSTTPIDNSGVILGDGWIEGNITNQFIDSDSKGEIRNAAGIANRREHLLITGTVENNGLIESLGGEMEFESEVTNNANGNIVGRDAVFRFNGGLSNSGDLFFGGDTTVYGDISAADLDVLAGGTTFIEGSLAVSGLLSMSVGLESSHLQVSEAAMIDAPVRIDFGQGYVPVVGDAFELITAGSLSFSSGSIPALIMPDDGGLLWSFDDPPVDNKLILRAEIGSTPLLGDFDLDGDVDGADFLVWQRGFGTIYDANDLANWQASFGFQRSVAVISAVPEPSTIALLMVCAIGLIPVSARRNLQN